jgi:hypothetical protein
MDIVEFMMNNWGQLLKDILGVMGFFAALAMFTPNKTDDKAMQFIMDWINFFGGNVGKASNK